MTSATVAARIEMAATGTCLTPDELQQILEHVAHAGFDPSARERVGGRLAGEPWQGRVLRGSDVLPPADVHYLRHVVRGQEWPFGTTLQEYIESVQSVVLDPCSGIITSRFQGALHVTVVRRSEDLQGSLGFGWILVDYRVTTGYWMTAFQPEKGLGELRSPKREGIVWLRRPKSRIASSGA